MLRHGLVLVALLCLAVIACSDDDPVTPPVEKVSYRKLTTRENVLYNLELAYNHRNRAEYEKLLDDNFSFFLSTGDIGHGLPDQWGRTEEVTIHGRLFDPNYAGGAPRCIKIALDLDFEGGLTWDEVPSGDETWYAATMYYHFQFDMEPDLHLISNPGSQVEFTLRNAGTEGAPHWQIVKMHDFASDGPPARSSSATEASTWGSVKALYR